MTTRDMLFTVLGATVAAAGFALAGNAVLAAAFLAGASAGGLACWRTLRTLTVEREAAELAARDLGLALMGAWSEANQLRAELDLPPRPLPALATVSHREEKAPCTSPAT